MSTKFEPSLRARAIWKLKLLKTGMPGALLEVELRKICTTPARESDFCEKKVPRCMVGAFLEVELCKICTTPARAIDLEVKIVKTPGARDVFEVQSAFRVAGAGILAHCKIRGRRRSS